MAIFFAIFLAVFAGINFLAFSRGLALMPDDRIVRFVFSMLYLFFMMSFFIGRILDRGFSGTISTIFNWIGSIFLAYLFYWLLAILLVDIVSLANRFLHFLPDFDAETSLRIRRYGYGALMLFLTAFILFGAKRANTPVLKQYQIQIEKYCSLGDSLRIAFVSDIHLGSVVGKRQLRRLTDNINAMQPDLVLLGGDIFDEHLGPAIRNNLGDCLREFKSTYGNFAVLGNHEYYGGVQSATDYLEDHNIRVLRDEIEIIGDALIIIGREDITKNNMSPTPRQPLENFLKVCDTKIPILVLDHQPVHLERAAGKIDLQLSGHTHDGQLWPLHFITDMIFRVGYGLEQIDGSWFYVSNGYGTWGPPIRTGKAPELVQIDLEFSRPKSL